MQICKAALKKSDSDYKFKSISATLYRSNMEAGYAGYFWYFVIWNNMFKEEANLKCVAR